MSRIPDVAPFRVFMGASVSAGTGPMPRKLRVGLWLAADGTWTPDSRLAHEFAEREPARIVSMVFDDAYVTGSAKEALS